MFIDIFEEKTKYPVLKALNKALHFIYEGKSVLIKTSSKEEIKELEALIEFYKLDYLVNKLTLKEVKEFYYPLPDLKALNNYYNSKDVKLTKNLLLDYLFYELNYNEIYLDCLNGTNKTYIDELYHNFTLIEQYFNKYSYNNNAFCYSNFLDYDKTKVLKIINKLLLAENSDEETLDMLEIKDDLLSYNALLDYDDLIFKTSFTNFKSLLEYQKANLDDLEIMKNFNLIFKYLSEIGAYNLISYIKKEENKTKILASLDYSLIKYNVTRLPKVLGIHELKEEVRKYDEAFLSQLAFRHLEKVKKMRLSCNSLVDSNLFKLFNTLSKTNPLYLDLFPLQIGESSLAFDEVVLVEERKETPITSSPYLVEVIEEAAKKVKLNLTFNHEDNLYYLDGLAYNLDIFLSLEEQLLDDRVISYKDLCLDYKKELGRLKEEQEPYLYKGLDLESYDFIYKTFKPYQYFDEKITFKENKDLDKVIQKIIKVEGPITKEEIYKRIKECSKLKLKKDFKEYLENYLRMNKINKSNDHYYYTKDKFRIRDYKKISEIEESEFKDFTTDLINASYKLSFDEYKKCLRHYLNVRISKSDEIYLEELFNKLS